MGAITRLWARAQPRLHAMAVALDCLALSVLKMGNHYRGATISAECHELEMQGKWRGRTFRPVIDFLFLWDEPCHCASSWLSEAYIRKEYERRAREAPTGGLP